MPTDGLLFRSIEEKMSSAVLVHVAGELDSVTAGELSACLTAAVDSVVSPAPVVVDLTEVTFLGACGIAMLLDHQDLCLRRGSALVVVARTPSVLRPLQVLELTGVLGVRPTVEDALTPPAAI